jgi:hypothetical protein
VPAVYITSDLLHAFLWSAFKATVYKNNTKNNPIYLLHYELTSESQKYKELAVFCSRSHCPVSISCPSLFQMQRESRAFATG